MEWYYYKDGDIAGPVNSDGIEGLIKTGELRSDDLVYKNGDADWIEIGLSGRFSAVAEDSVPTVNHLDNISEKEWIVLKRVTLNKNSTDTSSANTEKAFKQLGPFSTDKLKSQLKQGSVSYSDFCWKHGMENWQCIGDLFDRSENVNESDDPVKVETREDFLRNVLREEDFELDQKDDALDRPMEPTTEDLALQFSNEMSDFVRSNTWDLSEENVANVSNKRLSEPTLKNEIDYRKKEYARIRERWGELSIPKPVELFVKNVAKKISKKAKSAAKGLGKESLIVILIGVASILGVSVYWVQSQPTKTVNAGKVIDNSVQKNGLEIGFKAPKLAGRSMEIKIVDDARRILSTNPIKKTIRIVLDKNGEATVRLDQMGLPDGYYKFTSTVGLTEEKGTFFVGFKEKNFDERLANFQAKRKALKKQTEKPIATPKPVPKELKDFYKFSRELENGHQKLKSDPKKWAGFYQQWGKRFYTFKSSSLEQLKSELKSELGKSKELELQIDDLSGSLEKMSLDMDLSIRYGGGKKEFDEISTTVSQVMEKVRDSK